VASYGASPNGTVLSLRLVRDDGSNKMPGFSLYLAHCLSESEAFPLQVQPETLRSEACPQAQGALRVGDFANGRPPVYFATSGTWIVDSASNDRDGRMKGQLDMTFSDSTGTSYRVRGVIDLPEVLQ